MAESSGADAGAPNLNLNPEEKRVYGQLFRQADTDNVGVVTGEIAVKFFEKTRLESAVLGEIWQIADKENRGFLTPAGFGIVLRLIGHAQAGRIPTAELAFQQGPIPRFDGIIIPSAPVAPPPVASAPPPAMLQAQGTGGAPIRIPPLTPEKVTQYANLFENQPLQGNLLPGEQARVIFEKSGLPNEVLGRIWQLADTEQRGALVMTEFVIAMHLLTSMKTGALRGLPTILPAALYEAATRRAPVGGAPRPPQSPTGVPAPLSAIPRQLSGQAGLTQMRTGSPLARSPLGPQTTGGEWLVTPGDKQRFDQIYNELDKANKGYITGEEAVTFFSQSKLPSETLAQIWDLADIKSEGFLNKDEFAVAMYLIRQQRGKPDGSSPLPTTLPPNLVPPSLRSHVRPPTATASAFDPPAPAPPPPQPQHRPSAMDDLFGLDDMAPVPASAPAPQQVAVGTGGSNANDPFASSISPAPASPIRATATGSVFKPFVPSSSFGRGLTTNLTGGSTGSSAPSVRPTPLPTTVEDDLLGDNDDSSKAVINNDATELANLSNQIGSLTKQVQDVQTQRTTAQNDLNQSSAQKKSFESRLAQLRTLYEKEAEAVRSLEQQLTVSRAATQKLQSEIGLLTASYQDLQNQHQTIFAALQADQQENASLKQKISVTNAEIAALKPLVEKLKSEARQQKGLVAINKKQLATNEGEREKLKTEVSDLTKENEELSRQLNNSSPQAQMSSPALSTVSANNPFFKRTGSTDVAGVFSSIPTMKSMNEKSFDDVFGPTTSTPPPAASALFAKPQTTGTSTASAGSFATPTSTTPNVSRQATVDVPPPPPESRQLSSTNLPFVDAAESLSSSRQVSPPMSRAGPETPSVEAPNTLAPALEIAPSSTSLASASDSDATKQPTSPVPAPAAIASPGGFFDASKEPALHPAAAAASAGPSGFFDAPASKEETPKPGASASADPFGAVDEEAKAKEDFEAAFASFKSFNPSSSKDATAPGASAAAPSDVSNNAFSKFDSEFPPISELERAEEESDSEDDFDGGKGRGGFDDDFAPASPPPASKSVEQKVAEAPAGEAPTSAEVSVPAPKSASPVTESHTGYNMNDVFESAAPAPAAPAASFTTQSAVPASPKGAFDDLDDEFEGLEDAKEGSADDDSANISRDDFNAVFDSPPPGQFVKSQDSSNNTTSNQAPFGAESSYDFGSLSSTSGTGSATAVPTTSKVPAPATNNTAASAPSQAVSELHDWDAIFASLDDNPQTAAATSPTATATAGKASEPSRPSAPEQLQTEDSVNDDPILKNLTGMGYSRKDALSALEKYDYNLERVRN